MTANPNFVLDGRYIDVKVTEVPPPFEHGLIATDTSEVMFASLDQRLLIQSLSGNA
jgi:hypothetical protein